jgi:serine/threonine protein kinase
MISATELLKSMLQKDPSKRITTAEALDHEWFKTTSADVAVPLNFIKDNLLKYQDQ